MIFTLIGLAAFAGGGLWLWRDYRNGFPQSRCLLDAAASKIDGMPFVKGYLNGPERQIKLIDGAIDGLRSEKTRLEEQIGQICGQADLFVRMAKEANGLAQLAESNAKLALAKRNQAHSESREADAQQDELVYKSQELRTSKKSFI